ncbi:MAG: hypothetical protein AABZ30_10820 [Myxococcota bacterium]
MRTVNVKELKSRLSAYLREAEAGETFLVTGRQKVVARLGPPVIEELRSRHPRDLVAGLVAMGGRPPTRGRRPTDYRRTGRGAGLSTQEIDALLAAVRDESR